MRKVISFNGNWSFRKGFFDPQGIASVKVNWEKVDLPHTWNALDGQDGGGDYCRGLGCYIKEFRKIELPMADRYYLEFLGANASATVYNNGLRLAQHDGGYSTWRVDITDSLEDVNFLTVLVSNEKNDYVYPQNADFTFYGGLYRNVNLIAVSASHFDLDDYGTPGLKVTPVLNGEDAQVEIETRITAPLSGQTLHYIIRDARNSVVAKTILPAEMTKAILSIPNVHLWHGRKDPYLYRAEVLLCEGSEVLDNVSAAFGCRTFRIDPEQGFILNGEPYPLRGVSRHQDRKDIGNALLPEHHLEDMDLICELGATTIRLAHYQHDQYFYDLCDERGMIVWAEIPYISSHMENGRKNTVTQMKELIIQNYNHPSIVVWGVSNEITMAGVSTPDMLENHHLLNDMAHEMDPTRLTTLAAVSMCDMHDPIVHITDAVSYNHYFGWYGGDTSMNGPWLDKFHEAYPETPIGLSEYGCEALNWHSSHPKQGDYTEEYQAHYHEELIKQLFTRPYVWATHVWNMFDFGADNRSEGGENGQNHKGLVTIDRKYKKDAFYAYKAWLSDEPFVHICGKRYVDRVEDVTKVTVYSNLPEVELFVNGANLGIQASAEHFFYFDVPNAGESILEARAGDCRDTSTIRKVDAFNESYRLKEAGVVLNWFDVTEAEGCYSLNDTLGELLKSDEAKALVQDFMKSMLSGENSDMPVNMASGNLMQMMEGFTLVRLVNLMGPMAGKTPSKEELLKLNKRLNAIRR